MLSINEKHTTHHTLLKLLVKFHQKQKKVLDTVGVYHAITLDKQSHPLTTCITEWDRYMYLRLPQ